MALVLRSTLCWLRRESLSEKERYGADRIALSRA